MKVYKTERTRKTMKKLIFCIILAAAAAALSASDDFTISGWDMAGTPGYYSVTDISPSGLHAKNLTDGMLSFYFASSHVNGWTYDYNEPFTIAVIGFEDGGITCTNESKLTFYIEDADENSKLYLVPFSGPGQYTFTPADILPGYGYGIPGVVSFVSIGTWEYENTGLSAGASGDIIFIRGIPEPDPEEETVVPEPGVCAYGVSGIFALMGIKKRIRK